MKNEFNILLGGVCVGFQPISHDVFLRVWPAFQSFLKNEPAEVLINVINHPYPRVDLGSPCFEARAWTLFDYDGNSVIQLTFPESDPNFKIRTLELSSDGVNGSLYTGKKEINSLEVLSLSVPPLSFSEILPIHLLAQQRGLMIHSCGIYLQPASGILFAGVSGSGKSTTARIWQTVSGTTLLSDERVAVRKNGNVFKLYGTPWHSDGGGSTPATAPLSHIFILKHAISNHARKLSPSEAVAMLLPRSYLPYWDDQGMAFSLQFLEELCTTTPCYELGFVPDSSMVDYVKCLIGV